MKSIKLLFVISFSLILFSCQENSTPPIAETESNPFQTGNYWIYEVNSKDSNNASKVMHIDSMVVKESLSKEGKPSNRVEYYRDGKLYSEFFLSNTTDELAFYMKMFNPFMPLDSVECWSHQPERWYVLKKDSVTQWNTFDSLHGDVYPVLVKDGSGYKTISGETANVFKNLFDKNAKSYDIIQNILLEVVSYEMTGQQTFRLIKPDNVQFQKLDPKKYFCNYFDNGRAIISHKYSLTIHVLPKIGITSTSGFIHFCDKIFHSHTRKLIRYMVIN